MDPATYLGRLLRREDNVATLLAYLIAREPEPLHRLLGLRAVDPEVRMEVPDAAAGRYDLVLSDGSEAVAVLELKVGATEHGDQLSSYGRRQAESGVPLVLMDLAADGLPEPEHWRRLSLDRVFACWTGSSDETVRVISREVAEHLGSWRFQLDGPLSSMDRVMVRAALRAVKEELLGRELWAGAGGTVKGKPGLVVKQLVDDDRAVELVVELRMNSDDPADHWLYRVGVQVSDEDDTAEEIRAARSLAHEIALGLEPALCGGGLERSLPKNIAQAVVRKPKGVGDRERREARWVARIEEAGSESMGMKHPAFNHDWGRRLVVPFVLDVAEIGRGELIELVTATLAFLERCYRELPSTSGH